MARRAWTLNSNAPMALQIAADARHRATDYTDDHVWELNLGTPGSPALVLSTRYGGRVGLVSVVPMWWLHQRALYETQTYLKPPTVVAFAPGYLVVEFSLDDHIAVRAEYLALDSHAVGVTFTIRSTDSMPRTLQLDLIAFIATHGVEQKPTILRGKSPVLSFGKVGNIEPVMMLQTGGTTQDSMNKLRASITLPAKTTPPASITLRCVVAGVGQKNESRLMAEKWLSAEWEKPPLAGARTAAAIPVIETGDADLDALLAFSYQQALQAFLRPTDKLPHASFVAVRQPESGFRPHAAPDYDGATTRSGQQPALAYLLATTVAPINPALAKGVVQNYLAVQKSDGWIDWSPALDGGQRGFLCLPILARLAWSVWQYTEDDAFLRAAFPGLLKFFRRWLAPDRDHDRDGVPEWQAEAQTAYPFLPIFSRGLTFGQNLDIRQVESPDLVAYLLSEAVSLREIAFYLRLDDDEKMLNGEVERLSALLETFWSPTEGRYRHRDRDSHQTPTRVDIMRDGAGDQEHLPARALTPPARVMIEIVGGTSRPNLFRLRLTGIAPDGSAIEEIASADDFAWTSGRGSYTSRRVYAQIDRIAPTGLIRLFLISAWTPDLTALDITALLPLWAVDIPTDHREAIIALIRNPDHFWRTYGTLMFSAQDSHFQPDKIEFAAGVWSFWITLMGEGLIEAGDLTSAAELLHRFLDGMLPVVKREKAFYEGYHADKLAPLGARGHVGGIAPLHLLLRVVGVRIISPKRVWTGGAFAWGRPITITHQGVRVHRSGEGTTITFPSGTSVTLAANADWQPVDDPSPAPPKAGA